VTKATIPGRRAVELDGEQIDQTLGEVVEVVVTLQCPPTFRSWLPFPSHAVVP
jgi:hypothetical protein